MTTATLPEMLDGLRIVDVITRRFESVYSLRSADVCNFYWQGLLDHGEQLDDFAMWAGYHEIALERMRALERLARLGDDAPVTLDSLHASSSQGELTSRQGCDGEVLR